LLGVGGVNTIRKNSSRLQQTDSVANNIRIICKVNIAWTLIDIDNFLNNDVIMLSFVTNLNRSTAQEIVNWVTTRLLTGAFTPPTRLDS